MTHRELILGDCLEILPELPDASVDLVIADLPYGSTRCVWDERIDLSRFWPDVERILTPNSPVVMFADMRFAVHLINSNPKWFRFDLVWDKVAPVGFLNANRQPLRRHELMLVFATKAPRFRVVKSFGHKPYLKVQESRQTELYDGFGASTRDFRDGSRFPSSIVRSSKGFDGFKGYSHPTSKPIELLTFVIKSFTDEGMTVFDPTMGSGSTGVASVNNNRSFIGIERDATYFKTAKKRIREAECEMVA